MLLKYKIVAIKKNLGKIAQKIVLLFLSFLLLITPFFSTFTPIVYALSSPWTQSDWSGGSGQTNWSDTTKYSSSTDVTSSRVNQVTLTNTEKLSNTGFETDLTNWNSGAYTLNDQFTTDRAAGAVNGTAAEPTGGLRTVSDTNNVLSITGGLLNFATGGVAAGNPGMYYSSIPRALGLTMMGTITPISFPGNAIIFGFDTNQAGNIGGNALQFAGQNLQAFEGASAKANMGAYVVSTTYSVAISLRPIGAYYFIKGGAFTDWTLIWSSALQSNDPVFPAANVRINPAVYTTDNIRVPFYLWIPVPLAYSSFATVGGVVTETTGPDSQTTPSLGWTNQLGTWSEVSQTATAVSLTGGVAARTVTTSSADTMIDVALTRSAGNGGIVFRYQDTSNYLIAYHDGTNAKVDKVVDGITTNVTSAAGIYSAGAILRVVTRGTNVNLFYNGLRIGSSSGVTVSDFSTSTIHGLYTTDTSNIFDDFLIWPSSGYAVPDTDLTATRDTVTKYADTASAKLVAPSGNDANFTQSVDVGNTNTYDLSVYAYTDGSAVTSNDLSLYYDTGTISTTYTSVGGGWYRLTGTLTGAASSKPYGVQVKASKTVYIDNTSLSNYASSGNLISSIFDAGGSGNWGTLTYTATIPTNTTVSVKIRTSNDSTLAGATDFSLCDAITSGSDISGNSCISDDHRYVQYQIVESSSNTTITPTFTNFSLTFSPVISTSTPTNTDSTSSSTSCSDQAPGAKTPWLYGAIAQNSSSILLYFTQADSPITKYVLEYGTKSGEYLYGVQDMGVNERNQMTFLVESLSSNTAYFFRVRGQNGCAAGEWSNEISAKTIGKNISNQLEFAESQLTPVIEKTPKENSCQKYTVKSGDSLWSIAENLIGGGNNYSDIVEQNKETYPSLLGSNTIKPSWILNIGCTGDINQNKRDSKSTEAETGEGYKLKVKVLNTDNKPVAGAKVTIHSNAQETTTDKEGVAQFTNVEAGDHKVLIAYGNFEGEQSINLTGDVKEFNLTITVKQKPFSLSLLAYVIIAVMGAVIIGLVVYIVKKRSLHPHP